MSQSLKKKIRFIILGFFVLMIPIGYFVKNSIAIDMNNSAIQKVALSSWEDTNIIKESIKEIDKSIWLYRRNYISYANKAELLCCLKKYNEAIITMKQIFDFKSDYPEGLIYIGFIYDKLNLPDSANIYYTKALVIHEKRISDGNSDKILLKSSKVDKAFDVFLLDGKSALEKELKILHREYSNDPVVANLDSIVKNFNRMSYVNNVIK
ncbi:MAG: hypothetical protein HXX09_10660 [Bacteroidetes bacterium]|nr:hypothetical protein [Bacteroidota bacterium]